MQLVLQHCCKTTNPVSDFWHSSSCSSKWGSNWPRVSSPTQHVTTLSVSCARVMIFTQDLSMLEKRLASWKRKSMHCLPSSLVDMCICKYYCERFVPRSLFISRWSTWSSGWAQYWILGLQPRDGCQYKKHFLKNLHENGFYFQEERNTFLLDNQLTCEGWRDLWNHTRDSDSARDWRKG